MRMLIGYKAPWKTHTHNIHILNFARAGLVDVESILCKNKNTSYNILSVLVTYRVALPVGGCRCHLSRGWPCHTQRWGAARTVNQSAASHQQPEGSGTHTIHKEAHAGSHRTAPGSAPVKMFQWRTGHLIFLKWNKLIELKGEKTLQKSSTLMKRGKIFSD